MLNVPSRILLFVSSYLPLALSFGILYLKSNSHTSILIGASIALVLGGLLLLLRFVRRIGSTAV